MATPCLRVTQLDAGEVDSSLINLLVKQQCDRCLKFVFPKRVEKIKPEIRSALYGTLLYYTLVKMHQSVGQKLFGIMLADSNGSDSACKTKVISLAASQLLLFWWKSRHNDVYPSFVMNRVYLRRALDALVTSVKLAELANFLLFLRQGIFSRVLLRILGLRLIFDHPNPKPRRLAYDIVTRDILWRGFAESVLYFLTYMNIPHFKKYLRSRMKPFASKSGAEDLTRCSFCEQWPTQPHETNCGHAFCYYCAATAVITKSKCPLCKSVVNEVIGPKLVPIVSS